MSLPSGLLLCMSSKTLLSIELAPPPRGFVPTGQVATARVWLPERFTAFGDQTTL
jgi:hypothetical protein